MRILILFIMSLVYLLFAQDESWKIYDDSQVAIVEVTTDSQAVDFMYANPHSDSLHLAKLHFKNALLDETVDSVGIRVRGNTSRDSKKKSFKLNFNHFVNDREFYGVDKMNLNSEHNDPSIMRSKVSWDLFQKTGLASSRAAHAQVYINGKYYGLYINVEHIDKDFIQKRFLDSSGNLWKCLYPANLTFIDNNPQSYKLKAENRRVYALKTNEDLDDYSKLEHFIDILNNTPLDVLPDSLEPIFDVPGALKFFAMNVLTGMWDDYWSNQNNYYLYHEPASDKMFIIPYDYDNTFGIDWFSIDWDNVDPYHFPQITGGSRPLADRLLQVDQYYNLYSHFLDFYRSRIYQLAQWQSHEDSIQLMITPYAVTDTFRSLDYGFTLDDFKNSYNTLSYENKHVKTSIFEFALNRSTSLVSQINYKDAAPVIYSADWTPKRPLASDSIKVTISLFSPDKISEVNLEWQTDVGTNVYPFVNKPVSGSTRVEENDHWTATAPPLGNGKKVSFRIFAKDARGRSQYYPRTGRYNLVTVKTVIVAVHINEIMSDNDSTITDNAGEYDDWIELYNTGSDSIKLAGYYLSDKPDNLAKWQFPDSTPVMAPGEFQLVWCDEDQEQGALHTNFKLNKDGEFVSFTAQDGATVIDSITFPLLAKGQSFARIPDGNGNWQINAPTPGSSNMITAINNERQQPERFDMLAYPNPFNLVVYVRLRLPYSGEVDISIYDINGRLVYSKKYIHLRAGTNYLSWYAGSQHTLSSGIYFIRATMRKFNKSIRVMLIK